MVIAEFAKTHGFCIVKTYADPARSGMVLKRRTAMQHLLNDVLLRRANFESILVYDVTRWGRFQDVDEAAHYEFLCKSSGVPVYYCDEQFLNDGTAAAAIFKSMRRSQAGEFSRELSEKVIRAGRHVAEMGFRLGGTAGFGLARMIVSEDGRPLERLAPGEWKYCKTHRTLLVPGPKAEVALVREIFDMAASNRADCQRIAENLNCRDILFHTGKPWDYYDVQRLLTNPKYIGRNVWGRTSAKLGCGSRRVSSEHWAVKDGAFAAVVDINTFNHVQHLLRNRRRAPWTDHELLTRLKRLVAQNGRISQRVINQTRGMPSTATYYAHFGPLRKLYPLIGYRAERGTFTKILRRDQNERLRAQLFANIRTLFPEDVHVFHLPNRRRLILRLDNGLSVSVVLCRSVRLTTGEMGWKLYPTRSEMDYITLLCRLTPTNDAILDFYVFPFIEKRSWYAFGETDPWFKQGRRLPHLEDLCRVSKLVSRIDTGLAE
jgi:DNA invertase Pin-like site-specific DNA recombinase